MQTLTDVGICAVILEIVVKRLNTVRIDTGIVAVYPKLLSERTLKEGIKEGYIILVEIHT
jgi:hypothetical protein